MPRKKVSPKKARPKAVTKKKQEEKLIGRVVHYFSKIKVGVVKLSGALKVGDMIRIVGGEDTDFKQKISSIEKDHKKIKSAKAKQEVGLKMRKKARDGYKVYKVKA